MKSSILIACILTLSLIAQGKPKVPISKFDSTTDIIYRYDLFRNGSFRYGALDFPVYRTPDKIVRGQRTHRLYIIIHKKRHYLHLDNPAY